MRQFIPIHVNSVVLVVNNCLLPIYLLKSRLHYLVRLSLYPQPPILLDIVHAQALLPRWLLLHLILIILILYRLCWLHPSNVIRGSTARLVLGLHFLIVDGWDGYILILWIEANIAVKRWWLILVALRATDAHCLITEVIQLILVVYLIKPVLVLLIVLHLLIWGSCLMSAVAIHFGYLVIHIQKHLLISSLVITGCLDGWILILVLLRVRRDINNLFGID